MSRVNRASVVQGALEILETAGSAALTIPALALKLKIRPPSLYNHIESIGDLKRELSLHSIRLACESREKAASGKSRDKAVLAIIHAYRKFASEHPALYALSVAVPPATDHEWFDAFTESRELWLRGLEGYKLKPLEARHVARAFRSAVHGFVDIEVNGGWLEDTDIEESFTAMIEILLEGLHAVERALEKGA